MLNIDEIRTILSDVNFAFHDKELPVKGDLDIMEKCGEDLRCISNYVINVGLLVEIIAQLKEIKKLLQSRH